MIDKQTFVERIDEKSATLYRVARAILRNEADCEDALQESILKAWASRHMLKEERYFVTWLTRIVINECHTIRRKRSRDTRVAETTLFEADSPPELDVHAMIDGLPEKLRLPLVLHHIEGYSQSETAAMLRITTAMANNRLREARDRLGLALRDERR